MMRNRKSLGNVIGLLLTLLVIFVFFSIKRPQSFPTVRNVQTLLQQSSITVLVALGLTYVIVAGGIDLSVGSVAAFSCCAIAWCLRAGWSPILAALVGIGAGCIAGFINGGLITKLKVVPFIVTLGTMSLFRGAAKGVASEQTIDTPDTWLGNILATLGQHEKWMIFPIGVWVTIILAAVSAWALRYTRFGRHVVAIGSNEQAARLCGVPIARVKLGVYLIGGFFAGLAGLMYYSRLTIGDPTVAVGLELDGIAAAVVGGASLNGGEGTVMGSVLGALIMATLRSGAQQMELSNWIIEVVTGVIIVLAVALDQYRKVLASRAVS